MRVVLFSLGSRGDSEPLAALAAALKKTGEDPLLVTWSLEHLQLGFPACAWTDAFPLAGWTFGGARPRPGPRRGRPRLIGGRRVGAVTSRIFTRIGSAVPRVLGRSAAVRGLESGSPSKILELMLLNLPVVIWSAVVLLVHIATVPVALALSRSFDAFRGRPLSRLPSAIDMVMFVDAAIRTEWRNSTPPGARLLNRKLDHLRLDHPVPGELIGFIARLLADADAVVIAEAPDDPVYERLVLFFAAQRGIPCVRVSCFPRSLVPRDDQASFLAVASLPWLLPLVCSSGAAVNRATSHVARTLRACFEMVSGACDLWYSAVARGVLRRPTFLEFVNEWLVGAGREPTGWPAVLRPDYVTSPRFHVYSHAVLSDGQATGYWLSNRPQAWQPPPDLEEFLEGGEPAIYVSRVARSAGFQPALARALPHLPKCRVVINLPEGEGLPVLRENPAVRFVESIPHEWLLQKVSVAIHHAGAGTAAACLRAGLPSVAVPTWADQTLWAQRIHSLGTGPRPIHVRWITAAKLARAVRDCLANETFRRRSQEVARQLASEDALGSAVRELRSLVTSSARDAAVRGLAE